jgi:methanogenic corrinoid protein MtbC1
MTGIPRNTLIAWERRYGFIQPQRQNNSYRSYSAEDVDKLLKIKRAMSSGLTISESIALLKDAEAANDQSELPTAHEVQSSGAILQGQDHLDSIRSRLLTALTQVRAADVERILSELLLVGVETRIHQVFFPVLRRIGELWHEGAITIAQEHYASAVVRHQMVTMLTSLGARSDGQHGAVCTTMTGDLHELGALAVAIRLAQSGFHVAYLGPDVPVSDLGKFCHATRPELLCVSALLKQESQHLNAYARELRDAVPRQVRIVLGGAGVDIDGLAPLSQLEVVPRWQDFTERLS